MTTPQVRQSGWNDNHNRWLLSAYCTPGTALRTFHMYIIQCSQQPTETHSSIISMLQMRKLSLQGLGEPAKSLWPSNPRMPFISTYLLGICFKVLTCNELQFYTQVYKLEFLLLTRCFRLTLRRDVPCTKTPGLGLYTSTRWSSITSTSQLFSCHCTWRRCIFSISCGKVTGGN